MAGDTYVVEIQIRSDGSAAIRGVEQVQTKLKGIEGSARQGFSGANREAGVFERGLGGVKTAIIGMGTAFAAQFTLQAIGAMREAGQEVDRLIRRFESVNIGDALADRQGFETLRDLTGNVVTDAELARDATQLMLGGLAEDAEEAGRIIALALDLGGKEGMDAMRSALMNGSVEVLDTLGINSAQVRELRDQYTAAGMDSSEAFAQAVLVVGEETRARLGDSLEASKTNWDQLQVHIQNGIDDLSRRIAIMFEGIAGFINDTLFNTGGADPRATTLLMEMIRNQDNPDARAAAWSAYQRGRLYDATFGQYFFSPINQGLGVLGDYTSGRIRDQLVTGYNSMIERRSEMTAGLAGRSSALWQRALEATGARGYALAYPDNTLDIEHTPITPAAGFMAGDELKQAAEDAAAIRDALNAAAERGLVGDVDAQRLGSMLDDAIQIADEAERAAEEYERMTTSLPGLLGVDVTNPVGVEITDTVAAAMRDAGMSEEQIDAYIDSMDLTTGRQTELSQRFEQEVLPGITGIMEQFGADAATEASLAFQRGMTLFQTNAWGGPDDLLQLTGYRLDESGDYVSAGLGERPDNVFAGVGDMPAIEPAGSTPFGGMLAEVDDLTAKVDSLAAESLPLLAGAITPAADEMAKVRDVGLEVQGTLDVMSSKEYPLKFALTANDQGLPVWLKELIRAELVQFNRANGGTSPGTDPRRNRTSN
jgi:hypothetical protein